MTYKKLLRPKVVLPLIAICLLAGYLLWPLESDRFDIKWNKKLLDGKKEFLSKRVHQPDSVPNILLIMVDDLSVADIDLYTESAPVSTPQMNRLAAEGILFNNAYVTSPICSPSRASIATGRYQQRFGYEFQMHNRYLRNRLEYVAFKYFVGDHKWQPQFQEEVPTPSAIEKQGLPPSEITIAELLQKQGYSTGMVGKWHLGINERNLPCALGFDEFWGFYESHSLYIPEGTPGYVDQKIEGDWTDPYIWSGQRNGPHAIYEQCNIDEEPEYLTFRIADKAIDFMERQQDGPFFLWASFNAPHTPLQAPIEYVEQFDHVKDPVKKVHYAMIKALDDALGNVFNYLDESGLSENTIVFLISDNGGAEYNLTTDNGNYRGGKITLFEGGTKVPFVMRSPGQASSGITYDYPVISPDIFATISAVAGAELPRDRTYDGKNLAESISSGLPTHDQLFWQAGFNRSIRTTEWKLIWNAVGGDTALYDLSKDPFETNNVLSSNKAIGKELFEAHANWSGSLPEPLWPPVINYVFTDKDGSEYFFAN